MAYQIEVYCQEPSHEERRWDIGIYRSVHTGFTATWMWLPGSKRLLGQSKTMARLDGDRYIPSGFLPEGGSIRQRPRLKCKLCRLAYTRSDTTELFVVFDNLRRAGIAEISLRALINEGAKIANSTE